MFLKDISILFNSTVNFKVISYIFFLSFKVTFIKIYKKFVLVNVN